MDISIYFSSPLPGTAHAGRLRRHDDLNPRARRHGARGGRPLPLVIDDNGGAGAHGNRDPVVLLLLAPVYPHLDAKNEIEGESESEACADDGVADLCGGSEEAGEAATDLGDDGKGRELASGLGAVVLADLGEFGEEREGEGGDLKGREGGLGDVDEGGGEGGHEEGGGGDARGGGGRAGELAGGGVVDNKEGDDGVLDGEEEILAVRGEGELVAVRVGEGDGIGEGLEDIGDEGDSTGRPRGHD